MVTHSSTSCKIQCYAIDHVAEPDVLPSRTTLCDLHGVEALIPSTINQITAPVVARVYATHILLEDGLGP